MCLITACSSSLWSDSFLYWILEEEGGKRREADYCTAHSSKKSSKSLSHSVFQTCTHTHTYTHVRTHTYVFLLKQTPKWPFLGLYTVYKKCLLFLGEEQRTHRYSKSQHNPIWDDQIKWRLKKCFRNYFWSAWRVTKNLQLWSLVFIIKFCNYTKSLFTKRDKWPDTAQNQSR